MRLREVEHLRRLSGTHIVRLIGTYTFKQEFAILLYPAAEYNLETFMDAIANANEDDETEKRIKFFRLHALAGFFSCLAKTLEFLHGRLTRHMDIKPSNILVKYVSEDSSAGVWYKVYIADFGITRSYDQLADSETESPTKYTHKYAAPEIVDQSRRGFPSDIFSLGCVYVDMLATLAIDPQHTKADLLSVLKSEYLPRSYHENIFVVLEWVEELCSRNVGNHFFVLLLPLTSRITEMLDYDPSFRPTAPVVTTWVDHLSEGCCSQPSDSDHLSVEDGNRSEEDSAIAQDLFFTSMKDVENPLHLRCLNFLFRLQQVPIFEDVGNSEGISNFFDFDPVAVLLHILRKGYLETNFFQVAASWFPDSTSETFNHLDLFGHDTNGFIRVTTICASVICCTHTFAGFEFC
jgi:serine/threonine protein kinase